LEEPVNLKLIAALVAGVAGVTLVGRWGLTMLTSSTDGSADGASEDPSAEGDAKLPHTVESCEKMPNGTLCGPRGAAMLCVADACIRNVCGDSVVMDAEQCDDGNHNGGDGCSDTCRWEERPGCGDGVLTANEECDDGNKDDADTCTSRCSVARCGDGFAAASEECDDGDHDDTDECTARCRPPALEQVLADRARRAGKPVGVNVLVAGSGQRGAQAGAAGAGTAGKAGAGGAGASGSAGTSAAAAGSGDAATQEADQACRVCRETHCRNVLGADILSGCLEAVNSTFGAPPSDPEFLQQCSDVVSCARENHCAYRAERQAAPCYCGSISVDECLEKGPAEDAPCIPEWQAAARTTTHEQVLTRFSDLAFPAGWAYQLLDCDREHCRDCQTL
jgi:cysteine-rich repeat protein